MILCEKPITIRELGEALKHLPNNKTPGTDGLTTEFYKFFWLNIQDLVQASILYAFENNSLSIEQRRGILNLIPKKGKDLRHLKNWRPFSLLNTDYKILTKALALRLQKVIPTIVNSDQTGYIKGRYIGENIRTIFDIIQYTSMHNLPGIIVMLDFEKAFHSVSWNFLYEALKNYSFGKNFTKWIHILYENPEVCVFNNGFSSNFFTISRGIRQGCPISALLFLLVVEIMAIHIRTNNNIEGINISKTNIMEGNKNQDLSIKITQLADDTTLFLKDTGSLREVLNFMDYLTLSTGLKLNKSKSEAMWIGSEAGNKTKPLGLRWPVSSIKCLGVQCNVNLELAIEENFAAKLKDLRCVLNMWSQRNLSLKVAVLRSIALPQMIYISSVMYIPVWVTKEVNDLMFKFLWSNKKAHVRREVVIQKISKGGLKMPDFSIIAKAIKCTWIKQLLLFSKCKQELIRNFIWYDNNSMTLEDLIYSKLDTKFLRICSPFYAQILENWYEAYCGHKPVVKDILTMPLWHNKYIKIGGRPVHYPKWEKQGITKLADITDADGHILPKCILEEKHSLSIKQMEYNCLIHAVPSDWKRSIKGKVIENGNGSEEKMVRLNNKLTPIKKALCKEYYWEFINRSSHEPKAINKWNIQCKKA